MIPWRFEEAAFSLPLLTFSPLANEENCSNQLHFLIQVSTPTLGDGAVKQPWLRGSERCSTRLCAGRGFCTPHKEGPQLHSSDPGMLDSEELILSSLSQGSNSHRGHTGHCAQFNNYFSALQLSEQQIGSHKGQSHCLITSLVEKALLCISCIFRVKGRLCEGEPF